MPGPSCSPVPGRARCRVPGRRCPAVPGGRCPAVPGRRCRAVPDRQCPAVPGRPCSAGPGRPYQRVSPSRSPAVPARPAGPGGFPACPASPPAALPACAGACLPSARPGGRAGPPAPGHRPGRRTAAARTRPAWPVPAGGCAGGTAPVPCPMPLRRRRGSRRSRLRGLLLPRLALEPIGGFGIQPGAFGRDQVIGLAQPGQHFPDAVGIRRAARPDLPPDPVPGSAHERHPPALGQLTVAGCGHPGEVFQDEPVGGEVRRNLHAQIIPLKRQNVEPMPSSRQRRADRADPGHLRKRRRDGPGKGAAPYGLPVGRCAPTSYRTRSPCHRRQGRQVPSPFPASRRLPPRS